MSELIRPSQPLSDDFSGRVRLFPLPNLVMFPHVVQPLHIFEPRYRAMVADALAGDRMIAMALLRPGWEGDYEGNPDIFPTCCLGRILESQKLVDGRYHLLLQGVVRVRVVDEAPEVAPFRTAAVTVHEDLSSESPSEALRARHDQLLECIERLLPESLQEQPQWRELLESSVSLGTLSDVISYSVGLDVMVKQQLLEELDVASRAEKLVTALEGAMEQARIHEVLRRTYPMKFSEN